MTTISYELRILTRYFAMFPGKQLLIFLEKGAPFASLNTDQ